MNIINVKNSQVITEAVTVLKKGGLLIYPTETVYGLGVDATNQKAVNKVLKFKGQRKLKPILIAVSDQEMAEKYVNLNGVARQLYRTFLPGPVAVVSRIKTNKRTNPPTGGQTNKLQSLSFLARGIASVDGTVGVRIPDYPLVLKIIKAFGKPITSTSANISGARNPWSIADIEETTPPKRLQLIDLIIDAGQLPKRPASTVIDTSREQTEIVREGMVNLRSWIVDPQSKTETLTSRSPAETEKIGEKLISRLLLDYPLSTIHYPLVFALQGPLGAGKTVFTKGIAQALGIAEPIRSPSYTLVREYRIPPLSTIHYPLSILYHVDAWRISDQSEFEDLGLEQMLKPACPPAYESSSLRRGNIIVIEWIERLEPILKMLKKKSKIVLVEIKVMTEDKRRIQVTM